MKKILNKLSEFWFNFVSDIIPNDIITTNYEEFPDEFRKEEFKDRSMLVKKLKMLPVECIVRGYITGSGWAEYQKTGTVCNIKLPEGLQECQKLDEPIFTPSTKAELGDHDENISFERCKEILGDELAEKVKNATINIYKSFDKQYLRDWLSNNGYRNNPPAELPKDVLETTRNKYIEAYEKITGKKF